MNRQAGIDLVWIQRKLWVLQTSITMISGSEDSQDILFYNEVPKTITPDKCLNTGKVLCNYFHPVSGVCQSCIVPLAFLGAESITFWQVLRNSNLNSFNINQSRKLRD